MEWINTKEKHFAEIEKKESGYSWKSDFIDTPFLVAVETNKGWDIEKVVLTDGIGLECFCDGETSYYGWEVTDIDFYMIIENPKK